MSWMISWAATTLSRIKRPFYEGCLILGNESISNFYMSIIQSFAKNFEATIE
jgi:hypothetical protein